MLYLFDNTYIWNDQYIHAENHLWKSMLIRDAEWENRTLEGAYNYVYDNLDHAIEQNGGTFTSFFQFLTNVSGKFKIYAQMDVLCKIYFTYLKSVTRMDDDCIRFWLRCYTYRNSVYGIPYDDEYNQMEAHISSAETLDLSGLTFTPGYELLIASAFYDSDFAYKDKLKKMLRSFMLREIEGTILDTKLKIDKNILDPDFQIALGGTLSNYKNLDNYYDIPDLQVFNTSNAWKYDHIERPTGGYEPGTDGKFDISQATDAELTTLLNLERKVMSYLWPYDTDLTFNELSTELAISLKNNETLTNDQYNTCLNKILTEETLRYLPVDLDLKILKVIVPYFKYLKENNRDELYKYTLK